MSGLRGTYTFADLFKGYSRGHGQYVLDEVQGAEKQSGQAVTVRRGASSEDYARHIDGADPGIGIVPLLDDHTSVVFGAIDIDIYDIDIAKLERDCAQLPVILTRSKSGGIHIWLFCTGKVSAALVRKKLGEWAARLGFGGSEIFPKQTRRTTEADIGNWINLPYFGATRQAVYEGHEIGLEDFVKLANDRMVDEKALKAIEITARDYSDGPPCLQHLFSNGIPEGGRNIALFNLGIYFKLAARDNWEDRLVEANVEMAVPVGNKELQTIIGSLRKKDYAYQCDQVPLKPHCDRRTCVMRKFGISSTDGELPVALTGLTKIATEPPVFFLNVNDQRIRLETIRELTHFPTFQDTVLARSHKMIPDLPRKKWHAIIQELFDDVQVIEAPDDANEDGQIGMLLQGFVSATMTSLDREQLLKGNAWKDEFEQIHFRGRDFLDYMRKHGVRSASRIVWTVLKQTYRAKEGRWNVKGATVRWWSVDSALIGLQTEPFSDVKATDQLGGSV